MSIAVYEDESLPRTIFLRVIALLIVLCGAALVIGGAILAGVGGSLYYLLGGLVMVMSGVLLCMRLAMGAWLFLAFLLISCIWSLAESGADGWAFVPRLGLLTALAALLAIPAVRTSLREGRLLKAPHFGKALCAVLLLGIVAPIGALVVVQGQATRTTLSWPSANMPEPDGSAENWTTFASTMAQKYSKLDQIDTSNVSRLKVAWTYHFGMAPDGVKENLEVTPLKVGDRLYVCSPLNDMAALDARTGKEIWRFDARVDRSRTLRANCRGVAYVKLADKGQCARRILTATNDARIIAIDAVDGEPCTDFGDNGEIDLLSGMGEVKDGYYYVTSAPFVSQGKIIVGGWVHDNQAVGEPSGVVRAYDVATGDFAWAWDIGNPGDHDQPALGETYTRGTPNAWAPMAADPELGLVYIPTGNATPDYFGAHRSALSEEYASSIVAVDAATGEPKWHFQTVHHDLWDYDVAPQPSLVDLEVKGKTVPALVQATKRGEIFVLDRRTGVPIQTVTERRVPQGNAPGERYAPTQPFSDGVHAFGRKFLAEADMWGLTPFDQLWCRIRYRQARYDGVMTPPGLEYTIQSPSNLGGMNWGGVSIDPRSGVAFVNVSHMANYVKLLPRVAGADQASVDALHGTGAPQEGTPYAVDNKPFLSPLTVPCQQPPYGEMAAIDLNSGGLLWSAPLGTTAGSGPFGMKLGLPVPMGVPNIAGSIATRGGLVFIGASQDGYFRALDMKSGAELWRDKLPAGGQATPMTYAVDGKQFVVIAAGGNPALRTAVGDALVAYAID